MNHDEYQNRADNTEATTQENGAQALPGAKQLFGRFRRIQWLMGRYHMVSRQKHGPMGDTYRGQGRVLKLLKLKDEISQKELAYLLGMRPQSLGELLLKLEKRGYITRTPMESDRRSMIVRLTDEGKAVSTDDEPRGDLDAMFDTLDDEEKAMLDGYLARIISALEAHLEESPDFGEDMRPPFDERFGMDGWGGPRGDWNGRGPHGGCPHGPHGGFDGRGGMGGRDPRGFGPRGGFDGRDGSNPRDPRDRRPEGHFEPLGEEI